MSGDDMARWATYNHERMHHHLTLHNPLGSYPSPPSPPLPSPPLPSPPSDRPTKLQFLKFFSVLPGIHTTRIVLRLYAAIIQHAPPKQ